MHKILLVDDSEALLDLSRRALERSGYEVELAADGEQAWARMQRQRFDLLITDVLMPGKEGIELIQCVKRRFSGMPILAISGGGRNTPALYLNLAQKMGANATLRKPFTAEQLCHCAGELLKPQARLLTVSDVPEAV